MAPGNFVVCSARPENGGEILQFVVENIREVSILHKGLNLSKSELRCLYGLIIHRALLDNLSYYVVETTTDKIVGCAIGSVWHRGRGQNRLRPRPNGLKTRVLWKCEEMLMSEFWNLCPPTVDSVVRTELFLMGKEHRNNKNLFQKLYRIYTDESYLDYQKISGIVEVAVNSPGQLDFTRFGSIGLAEMKIEEFLAYLGIKHPNLNMTKAVLYFNVSDDHKAGFGAPLAIKCLLSKI
ncbi:hypothetical protein L596_024229 [Steinernema carpocapsae]|uniref:YitH acetyltransferase (GNAT) domain-containing protein n=1 Tax=Steinernema carpocapsae TaxID=34508 RepID=A0A4U5MG49_STECR|nr:hypothetical protein L596_024229 [Steinernema carpocapsae]